jgi:SAM-dependent methyltransferase
VEVTLGTWRICVERTPPTGAELAATYDEAAGSWHGRLEMLGYPQAYHDLFPHLEAEGTLRGLRDGGRVLDCGISTGAFSLALAGKVAAPLRIEGVDISPSMLFRARLNLDRAGVNTWLHLSDVEALPFEDDTFEAVIGANVLEHLDNPFAALSEMARVLKPGGLLVVIATRRGIPCALLRLRWRHERINRDRLVRGWRKRVWLAFAPTRCGPAVPCLAGRAWRARDSRKESGNDRVHEPRRAGRRGLLPRSPKSDPPAASGPSTQRCYVPLPQSA